MADNGWHVLCLLGIVALGILGRVARLVIRIISFS